jgi:hypothetical protein
MPSTRFDSRPVGAIPTGYESPQITEGPSIPSAGIEDVDQSLVACLNDDVQFFVQDDAGAKKVEVIFAVGEKWSMLKNHQGLRDHEGRLSLPIITVRRKNINHSTADITGRGMNQSTGEIKLRYRLSERDRVMQNLMNRFGIKNQTNLLVESGDLEVDPDIKAGALLAPKLDKNTWEILVVPQPQFFTAEYEVTMWAQYTEQLNVMTEKLMAAYLAPGNRTLRLNSDKGFWYIANFGESYASEDNSDSATGEALVRKVTFQVNVPAYSFAPQNPGDPIPIRRYLSNPQISFDIQDLTASERLQERVYDDGMILGDVADISTNHNFPNPNLIDGHILLSPDQEMSPSLKRVDKQRKKLRGEKTYAGRLIDPYSKRK